MFFFLSFLFHPINFATDQKIQCQWRSYQISVHKLQILFHFISLTLWKVFIYLTNTYFAQKPISFLPIEVTLTLEFALHFLGYGYGITINVLLYSRRVFQFKRKKTHTTESFIYSGASYYYRNAPNDLSYIEFYHNEYKKELSKKKSMFTYSKKTKIKTNFFNYEREVRSTFRMQKRIRR